jgi:hypothetical protein
VGSPSKFHDEPGNLDGLIDELIVMVRPLSGALALAEAMKAELLAVQGD